MKAFIPKIVKELARAKVDSDATDEDTRTAIETILNSLDADDTATLAPLERHEDDLEPLRVTAALLGNVREGKTREESFASESLFVLTQAYRLAIEELVEAVYVIITQGARVRTRKYAGIAGRGA